MCVIEKMKKAGAQSLRSTFIPFSYLLRSNIFIFYGTNFVNNIFYNKINYKK